MSKLRMDRERPIAQTVRPIRAALVAGTGFPVCPNCDGGSPFPGEDSAAAAAGTFAVSTAGDKKGRHLRFLPSLNTRFPCKDSLGADGRLRKQEKKYDSRFTFFVGAHCASITRHIRSVGYITATHMVKSTQARHKVNCRSV